MDSSQFLDASFVIALSAEDDQFHAAAQSCWNSVLNDQSAMVTSSAILEEVATFLNSRNKHSLAVKVGNYLLESPSIDVIHLVPLFSRLGGTISSSIKTNDTL